MTQNRTLIYKSVPHGMPVPGKDLLVEARELDLGSGPPLGGILTKNLYASFDPYLRARMSRSDNCSSIHPFQVGQPVVTYTIAQVLESDIQKFSRGQILQGMIPVEEFSRISGESIEKNLVQVIDNPFNLDVVNFVSSLGMPGLTAYSSFYEIGKPKRGEVIFISSASGAVGSLVGQLAQREGLRVIGSVGSNEKLEYILNDIKFDGGFNYKTEKPVEALKRLAPEGIDIYYDNVGGEHLDAALEHMNRFGRVIACGMISEYNKENNERYEIKNLLMAVARSITIRGFLVHDTDIGPKYLEERNRNISQWLSEGSLKTRVSVTEGIENAAEGFVGLLEGKNVGKAVLKISSPCTH